MMQSHSLSTRSKLPEVFSQQDLRAYQLRMSEFVMNTKRGAAWADMRTGKTATTLTAFNALRDGIDAHKLLVIAPDFVIKEEVWPRETKKWEHLQHLRSLTISNNHKQRRLDIRKVSQAEVVCCSFSNLLWLCFVIFNTGECPFDMIAIDEASAFKSSKTKRFIALDYVIQEHNPRVVELTGTPTSSGGLLNVWSQIFLLDQGERLGKTYSSFQRRYFYNPAKDWRGYKWIPFKESSQDIYDKTEDLIFRLDARDHLELPKTNRSVSLVELPPSLQSTYKELEREYLLEFTEEEQADIEASSKGVLSNKLVQFADGAVYDENKQPHFFHNLKLDALERFLSECNGRVLLAYNYKFSRDMITDRFPFAVHVKEKKAISRWCDGKIDLMICDARSVAYGLDLWPGSYIYCWYGNTWQLEINQQFEARLKHPSQQTLLGHRIVTTRTKDEDVLASLESGATTQAELLQHMREATRRRMANVR